MAELIIGTAGHIDHGKTALIKALNGFEGDTLKEEKDRQITLQASYSFLKESLKELAFIDVPGHEGLIRHMVGAANSFKYCLFVVDINEGLMPQSIEHLKILEHLGVCKIIPVLSKCDKCKDIKASEAKILEELAKFKLDLIKVFKTSTKDEASIKKLRNFLLALEDEEESKGDPRVFIDRAFSLKGLGCVVTGSLECGEILLQEKLLIPQTNKEYIVKNIQIHGHDKKSAKGPSRVALSLKADLKDLHRGYMLCKKGIYKPCMSVDVAIFTKGLSNCEVEVLHSCARHIAKLKIIGEENGVSFATLYFKKEVYMLFKDKLFLLLNKRFLAGALVLNPISEPLKRPLKLKLLSLLLKDDFKATFALLVKVHKLGFGLLCSKQRFGLSLEEARDLAKGLKAVFIDELCLYDESVFTLVYNEITRLLRKNPYALLSPSLLHLNLPFASLNLCKNALLNYQGLSFENGIFFKEGLLKKECEDVLSSLLLKQLSTQTPQAPNNIYEELSLAKEAGDKLLLELVRLKKVVKISKNVYISIPCANDLVTRLKDLLAKGPLDVQELKKSLNVSRKYAIAFLEYLDKEKITSNLDGRRTLKSTC